MAPASGTVDDFTFIMTCLKHVDVKPKVNFEEVAKETGAKSGNACYHRHWGIMKKWGLAGGSGRGRQPVTAVTTKTAAPRKRKVKSAENSNEESPLKRTKATPKKNPIEPKMEEEVSEDNSEEGSDEGSEGEKNDVEAEVGDAGQ